MASSTTEDFGIRDPDLSRLIDPAQKVAYAQLLKSRPGSIMLPRMMDEDQAAVAQYLSLLQPNNEARRQMHINKQLLEADKQEKDYNQNMVGHLDKVTKAMDPNEVRAYDSLLKPGNKANLTTLLTRRATEAYAADQEASARHKNADPGDLIKARLKNEADLGTATVTELADGRRLSTSYKVPIAKMNDPQGVISGAQEPDERAPHPNAVAAAKALYEAKFGRPWKGVTPVQRGDKLVLKGFRDGKPAEEVFQLTPDRKGIVPTPAK